MRRIARINHRDQQCGHSRSPCSCATAAAAVRDLTPSLVSPPSDTRRPGGTALARLRTKPTGRAAAAMPQAARKCTGRVAHRQTQPAIDHLCLRPRQRRLKLLRLHCLRQLTRQRRSPQAVRSAYLAPQLRGRSPASTRRWSSTRALTCQGHARARPSTSATSRGDDQALLIDGREHLSAGDDGQIRRTEGWRPPVR